MQSDDERGHMTIIVTFEVLNHFVHGGIVDLNLIRILNKKQYRVSSQEEVRKLRLRAIYILCETCRSCRLENLIKYNILAGSFNSQSRERERKREEGGRARERERREREEGERERERRERKRAHKRERGRRAHDSGDSEASSVEETSDVRYLHKWRYVR